MDKAATQDEVRLRKGSSLKERLIRAASGALVLLIAAPGIIGWASGGPPLALAVVWALPLGCFLVGVAALERNVAWIITRGGILIGEQRPLGRVRKRLIGNDDIAELRVRKNKLAYPASFSVACSLASGDILISPPLPDITRVNETCAAIARLLGRPDAAAVKNPLDAANAEIHLGTPIGTDAGRIMRLLVPVLAGLCSLPFLAALWIGEREFALELALPLGLIAAFALTRNAHRLAGTFWIVRHGEIRIERMALNGRPSVQTITGSDVEAVDVDESNSRHRSCTISIRLRSGKTFRSPTRQDESAASAVRAEIARRLGLES
jgi:hypothetical protein